MNASTERGDYNWRLFTDRAGRQNHIKAQPSNVDDHLIAAGMTMNARAALPNRGITPMTRRA